MNDCLHECNSKDDRDEGWKVMVKRKREINIIGGAEDI